MEALIAGPCDKPDEPDLAPRQAPVTQQLLHKVPRREVRALLRRCPPLMAQPSNLNARSTEGDVQHST